MSLKYPQYNCELSYPAADYTKQTIEVDDDSKTKKWVSETVDSFQTPKKEKKGRKELLMEFFRLKAAKEVLEEYLREPPPLDEKCMTEYLNNYYVDDFVPTMERPEFNKQAIKENPLYSGDVRSFYKEQYDKKNIKPQYEYRNEKRPFARKSIFTTPPEIAMEEPINGF